MRWLREAAGESLWRTLGENRDAVLGQPVVAAIALGGERELRKGTAQPST